MAGCECIVGGEGCLWGRVTEKAPSWKDCMQTHTMPVPAHIHGLPLPPMESNPDSQHPLPCSAPSSHF